MKYTALQFDESIDWSEFDGYVNPRRIVSRLGAMTVKVNGNTCGHETCYETHEQVWVFQLGDQYFQKEAEFSSYDGIQWKGDSIEVHPVPVTTESWEPVKVPVLPKPPFTAEQVRKALEAPFAYGKDGNRRTFQYRSRPTPYDPEPKVEEVAIGSWAELAEHIECGTLWVEALGNLPITQVSRKGEFELSSGIECVFSVGEQLFHKGGIWVSHDGAHWDGELSEVVEAEKTVKFWKTV